MLGLVLSAEYLNSRGAKTRHRFMVGALGGQPPASSCIHTVRTPDRFTIVRNRSVLRLSLPQDLFDKGPVQIRLLNMHGRLVQSQIVNKSGPAWCDLADVSRGVYVLRVISGVREFTVPVSAP
jgi:hypothetical protein